MSVQWCDTEYGVRPCASGPSGVGDVCNPMLCMHLCSARTLHGTSFQALSAAAAVGSSRRRARVLGASSRPAPKRKNTPKAGARQNPSTSNRPANTSRKRDRRSMHTKAAATHPHPRNLPRHPSCRGTRCQTSTTLHRVKPQRLAPPPRGWGRGTSRLTRATRTTRPPGSALTPECRCHPTWSTARYADHADSVTCRWRGVRHHALQSPHVSPPHGFCGVHVTPR